MYTKINYIIKFGKILKLLFLGHQPHSTTVYLEKKIIYSTIRILHM